MFIKCGKLQKNVGKMWKTCGKHVDNCPKNVEKCPKNVGNFVDKMWECGVSILILMDLPFLFLN